MGCDYKFELPDISDSAVNIEEKGALKNVFHKNTAIANAKLLNRLMKEMSENGGMIVIPEGIWYMAPIFVRSNINLHIKKNAVLKFPKIKEAYPVVVDNYEGQEALRTISPINMWGADNAAITGEGVIDGCGDEWRPVKKFKVTDKQWDEMLTRSTSVLATKESQIWFPSRTAFKGNELNIQVDEKAAMEESRAVIDANCGYYDKNNEPVLIRPDNLLDGEQLKAVDECYDFYRPVMVNIKNCDRILLEGVTFRNSPAWNIHPYYSSNLTVRSVKISNPYYAQNGDGIDVESCRNVHIHDSVFETGDDAICIKSGKGSVARSVEGVCENIYIHNCLVNEGHGGFVIGSEMSRGVRNIVVEKCSFLGTDVGIRLKSAMGRGGVVENVKIQDITMADIKGEAIIMTMGYVLNLLNRNEDIVKSCDEDVPYFRNMLIQNISCDRCKTAIKLNPIEGMDETISDITIKDSTFSAKQEDELGGVNIVIENVTKKIKNS